MSISTGCGFFPYKQGGNILPAYKWNLFCLQTKEQKAWSSNLISPSVTPQRFVLLCTNSVLMFTYQNPSSGVVVRWFPSPPMKSSNRASLFASMARRGWYVSEFTTLIHDTFVQLSADGLIESKPVS